MKSLITLLAFLGTLIASPAALAWTLQGQVVAVISGDTIRVRDDKKVQHTVRLAGLDAPEKFQTYGQRSLDSLRELVFQRYVVVEVARQGASPRVGLVRFGARDINLEQLQLGGAWYAASHAPDLPAATRQAYADAQEDARQRRVGLWREKSPIPPWEFRAGRRK